MQQKFSDANEKTKLAVLQRMCSFMLTSSTTSSEHNAEFAAVVEEVRKRYGDSIPLSELSKTVYVESLTSAKDPFCAAIALLNSDFMPVLNS